MADMCYYGNVILHLQQHSHRLNLLYFFYSPTWFNNLFITQRKVFLAELMVPQAVQKLPACHGT